MSKPKVQPSTSPQFSRPQVFILLCLGHRIPDLILLLVPPDVIGLGEQEHHN